MRKFTFLICAFLFVPILLLSQDRIIISDLSYDTIQCKLIGVNNNNLVIKRSSDISPLEIPFINVAECTISLDGDFIVVPVVTFDTIIGKITTIASTNVKYLTEDGVSGSISRQFIYCCLFDQSPTQDSIRIFDSVASINNPAYYKEESYRLVTPEGIEHNGTLASSENTS